MARIPNFSPMEAEHHEAHCPLAMCSGAQTSLCQCSAAQVASWSQKAQAQHGHYSGKRPEEVR